MEQRYVSEELTHFVGRKYNGQDDATEKQYQLLLEIIRSGKLGIGDAMSVEIPYDIKLSDNLHEMQGMVCFCDIPVSELELHMQKYSRVGLSFKKPFLAEFGANPVFYVASASKEYYGRPEWVNRKEIFDDSFRNLMELFKGISYGIEHDNRYQIIADKKSAFDNAWGFLFFLIFNYMKFYDDRLPLEDEDNYYMEREWRLRGPVDFSLTDICRIIVPEGFKERISQDLPDYMGDITLV